MGTEDAAGYKKALRQTALSARDALTKAQQREKSGRIADFLFSHPCYQKAGHILVYASFGSEVRTEEIIRRALQDGKTVYCPVMSGKRRMLFCALEGVIRDAVLAHGLAALPKNKIGIPEPDIRMCGQYSYLPDDSLMIMPGTVFDKKGARIGYGGGFYDTFLAEYPMRTVGIFYDCQRTKEEIPCEEHDKKPDRILTESGWMTIEDHQERMQKNMTEQLTAQNKEAEEIEAKLSELGARAVRAKYELQTLPAARKNEALRRAADGLLKDAEHILSANAVDMENGQKRGMHEGLLDRLKLTKQRIEAMAQGLLQIAELEDPVGTVMEQIERPNGLKIRQVRVPLGVIGIIYESRPNVTADAFGLCFKTGNAVILKGGSDALCSNQAIAESLRNSLGTCGISPDAVQLITDTDRAVTMQFMKLNRYVDVLIPRGGAGLIRAVVEGASIPVIETGTGNCHIYVDADADLNKAVPIIMNAKTQRIGVCNACESLVIHEKIKDAFLPVLAKALRDAHVEIRADEQAGAVIGDCTAATEEDFSKEYLDYIISVKTVADAEEAIAHINRCNTGHSDAIITENRETAQRFLDSVDAACVYVNASTRFTDGFEFGFGAEIGISTQKLHARGPMGLRELTSYKYQIVGDGQIRG